MRARYWVRLRLCRCPSQLRESQRKRREMRQGDKQSEQQSRGPGEGRQGLVWESGFTLKAEPGPWRPPGQNWSSEIREEHRVTSEDMTAKAWTKVGDIWLELWWRLQGEGEDLKCTCRKGRPGAGDGAVTCEGDEDEGFHLAFLSGHLGACHLPQLGFLLSSSEKWKQNFAFSTKLFWWPNDKINKKGLCRF